MTNDDSIVIISTILFGLTCVLFLKLDHMKNESLKSDMKSVTCPAARKVMPLIPTFPWEPANDTTANDTIDTIAESHSPQQETSDATTKEAIHTQAADSQNSQLEFLASMTFAGGGLRAPSCLCCQ